MDAIKAIWYTAVFATLTMAIMAAVPLLTLALTAGVIIWVVWMIVQAYLEPDDEEEGS